MKSKYILFSLSAINLLCACKANLPSTCIENPTKAIEIAEKEWLKVYGNGIYDKKPFVASLRKDSVWVVQGTFKQDSLLSRRGGVPYAEIDSKTCKILKISHGK